MIRDAVTLLHDSQAEGARRSSGQPQLMGSGFEIPI